MKRKNSIVAVVICFVFAMSSCTAVIKREGYNIDEFTADDFDCANIIVIKNLNYNPELVEIVGKIKASDSGFSVTCSEEYVIESFIQDACATGADIVNITKDAQPNLWSSCYRATAELIRIKDREMLSEITSDEGYSNENVSTRSEYTECMNKGIIAAGALGGIVGALILNSICKSRAKEKEHKDTQEVSPLDEEE